MWAGVTLALYSTKQTTAVSMLHVGAQGLLFTGSHVHVGGQKDLRKPISTLKSEHFLQIISEQAF